MATGDLAQFGAKRAFQVWQKYVVSADGTPIGLQAPCVVRSVVCLTDGTIAGIYNSSGAALGTNYTATAIALTANQRIDLNGGRGLRFVGGLYLDITGGTYLVLAAQGA